LVSLSPWYKNSVRPATEAASRGELFSAPFRLLLALSLFFLVLGPVAAAAALRHARD
jgi:heme exporter protein B